MRNACLSAAALAFFSLSACSDITPETGVPARTYAPARAGFTMAGTYHNLDTSTKTARRRQAMANGAAIMAFITANEEVKDWRVAQRNVDRIVAQHNTGEEGILYRTAAAAWMLDRYLLVGPITEDRKSAISQHTTTLTTEMNPDLSLINPALAALEGYWPDERLARVIDVVIDQPQAVRPSALRKTSGPSPNDRYRADLAALRARL